MAMKQFGVVFTILAIISVFFADVRVRESMAACNDFPGLGVDWSNCDKTNADLTGATLTDANLYGAILSGANLTNANLYGAILSRANLTDAVLINASLSEATLTDSILHGADLTKARMYNAALYGANLIGANLSSADLTNANLTNAVLTNAVLTNAILYGATLYGATFSGANLTSVDLTNANMTGAILTNAVLSNAVLRNAMLYAANLSGTNLSGVNLSDAKLINADLTHATLYASNLSNADLTNASLYGTHLNNADLTYANLSGANLSYADMTNIMLNGTVLSKTNLTGVTGLNRNNTGGIAVIWDSTTCPDDTNSSSRNPQTCFPAPEPDKYEPDNAFETAKLILVNPAIPDNLLPSGYEWIQNRNFYSYGDEDWVIFYVNKGNSYRLSVNSPGKNCDPVIEIYDSNRQMIKSVNNYGLALSEDVEFSAESDGICYFRIRQCDNSAFCHSSYGEDTEYTLTVSAPYIGSLGLIEVSGLPAGIDVTINTPYWKDRKISTQTGTFFDWHTPGTYTMSAKAEGYESCTQQIDVREIDKTIDRTVVNTCLKPSAAAAKNKAVLVAGGGHYPANELWKATKLCTNTAFLSLLSQGYSKENIYYLSSESSDADGDGVNDVDADAGSANLSYAINEWAEDAADLILYMVDHGGDSLFQINGTKNPVETISADTLDNWLDNLQMTMPGRLIFVYDACRSGSFLSMKPPAGKERIVITASSANERAWHLNDGILSFSYQFWASVLVKGSLYSSFVDAKNMMKNDQTACLDANGNGICSESDKEDQRLAADIIIGKGRIAASTPPVIGRIVGEQVLNGEKSAKLWAGNISGFNRINRVWAVIVPPDYDILSPNHPVTDLPMVELRDSDQDGVYECDYDKFSRHGTYKINIYATDTEGSYAVPQQTTVVQTKGNACIFVSDDLAFNICAEYHAVKYGFTLMLDNPAQLSWKADLGTFRVLQSDPGSCISVRDDLKLDICAEYQGKNFGFTMNYDKDAMWKMDVGSFTEIR